MLVHCRYTGSNKPSKCYPLEQVLEWLFMLIYQPAKNNYGDYLSHILLPTVMNKSMIIGHVRNVHETTLMPTF
jgi:hypothetical protein